MSPTTGLHLLQNLQPDIVFRITPVQERRLLAMTFDDVRSLPKEELKLFGLKMGPMILLQNGRVRRRTPSIYSVAPPRA